MVTHRVRVYANPPGQKPRKVAEFLNPADARQYAASVAKSNGWYVCTRLRNTERLPDYSLVGKALYFDHVEMFHPPRIS